jgi:RNA polymerase sigma-70 factor (ECF subfamily)
MSQDFRERARWLARNILPHEELIRAKLRKRCVYDLEIEDVIQETYAHLLSLPSLETIRYPRQYAIRTALAIIIDHVRHMRVVSITSCENLEEFDVPLPEVGVEQRLEYQGEIMAVATALAQLPPKCREVLMLRRMEGLSQREVAQRLRITEKTVEKHMANGIKYLLKIFGRGGKTRTNTSAKMEAVSVEDAIAERGDLQPSRGVGRQEEFGRADS